MTRVLLLVVLVGCEPMPDAASDHAGCNIVCLPNLPSRVARTAGKISCECDVRTDGGVVRSGTQETSHYFALCDGHAIKRISTTVFGEDVECAP